MKNNGNDYINDYITDGTYTEEEFEPYFGVCDRIDAAMCVLRAHEPRQGGGKFSEAEIVALVPIMLAEAQRERQTELLAEIRDAIKAAQS